MYKPPVAFLVFNRPQCTEQVFEQIRRFKPGHLLLVADGPRAGVESDVSKCETVREVISRVDWPCEVRQNFAVQNMGCKERVSSGLDWVFSLVDEAIVLEDDCLPNQDFFGFCSELLRRYRLDPSIAHIGGSNCQNGIVRGDASYYFSRFPYIWGWASWRRAWQNYDVSISDWPQARQEGWLKTLGLDRGEQIYWAEIFDRVHSGHIDTWDYQWFYSCWRHKGLGILPNVNLITNIGAGPDATHTKLPEGSLAVETGRLSDLRHPRSIRRDTAADRYTSRVLCFFSRVPTLKQRIGRKLRRGVSLAKAGLRLR